MSLEILAEQVLTTCRRDGLVLSTAESCTGGMVSAALTAIGGSSDVFDRGFVTYSNAAKHDLLGVPLEHTRDPGAVSALVAEEMVIGALTRSAATIALSITGIAGPGGGSADKPVGLVYVAVAKAGGARVVEHRFREREPQADRGRVRHLAAEAALRLLLESLGP